MYNGEEDLVEDLKLVRKTYADSLIHLNILNPEEEKLGRFLSLLIDGRVSKTYADSLIHLNIINPEEEKLGRFLSTDRWQVNKTDSLIHLNILNPEEGKLGRFLSLPIDGG